MELENSKECLGKRKQEQNMKKDAKLPILKIVWHSLVSFLGAWGNIFVMILMLEILPTADVVTDIKLGVLWSSSRGPWALAILTILLSHTVFTSYLWYQLEPRENKKFSWIFVILQVYPQYRAAGIIFHTVVSTGEEVVENKKFTYDRMLSCVEPFVESIPQLVVCTASFFSAWGKLTGNLDDTRSLKEITGGSTEDLTSGWVDIPWEFAVTFALSLLSASFGIVRFYKDGPMGFISNNGMLNGVLSFNFLFNLVGTMSFLAWRLTMMASMITSTGYLIPLIFSPSNDLFLGHCSSIVGVQIDRVNYRPLQTEQQSEDIINPVWNCQFCEDNEYGHVRCDDKGKGDRGTCYSDCDCPSCAPFCSAFKLENPGYCQNNARYGRRSVKKSDCGKDQTQTQNSSITNCKKTPIQSTPFNNVCQKNQIFVRYELTGLVANWGSKPPVYLQEVSNYTIVWDSERRKVMYSFPPKKCLNNREHCEDWHIPQQFFCTKPVTAGVLMWLTTFVLPTFLLNLFILITILRRSFLRTILHFPPLLLQGIFGVYLYGPVDGIRGVRRKDKQMAVSSSLTGTNFFLCLVQQSIAIFILSRNFSWTFLLESNSVLDSRSSEEKSAIAAIRFQLYLSFSLLFVNLLCTIFVLRRTGGCTKQILDPEDLCNQQ